MKANRVLGASVALAPGLVVASVFAQTPGPAGLTYRAAPGCPDEAVFRARVAQRIPVPLAGHGDRQVSVMLESSSPSPSRGTLVWTTGGEPIVREVSGATCDEVASALALIAAVLLEQGATPEPGTSSRETVPSDVPAVPAPSPPAAPTLPGPPLDGAHAERPSRGPARDVTVRLAAGAHAGATTGVGPSLAGGGRLFGEAAIDVATRPAVRLSLAWYPGTDLETDVGTVHFSLLAGRFEACPIRIEAPFFSVSPCGVLDVGRLGADAAEAGGGREARIHIAPGTLVRIAWPIGDFLAVEVEGGAGFPLDHYRFFFDPRPDVYEVPAVSGSGGIGLAVRFP